jgi:hypothetical protein
VWSEVRELIQERTRTAAAEWSRLVALQGVMTKEAAHLMVLRLVDAVRDNVLNPRLYAKGPQAVLSGIQTSLSRALALSHVPAADQPPPPSGED